jgi:hypothetical protein
MEPTKNYANHWAIGTKAEFPKWGIKYSPPRKICYTHLKWNLIALSVSTKDGTPDNLDDTNDHL